MESSDILFERALAHLSNDISIESSSRGHSGFKRYFICKCKIYLPVINKTLLFQCSKFILIPIDIFIRTKVCNLSDDDNEGHLTKKTKQQNRIKKDGIKEEQQI